MADDLDEDFDPEAIEEDIDEASLEDEALVDDDDDLVSDELVDSDALEEPEEEEESAEDAAARLKKRREEEEDDDDEVDPDDVEADLDTILKDRIAAADDDEEDEDLEEVPRTTAEAPDGVIPKRANEFVCTGCFLLVNRGQFGPEGNLQCPVGESECPAIVELQRSTPSRSARAKR